MFRTILSRTLIIIFLCSFVLASGGFVHAQDTLPGWSQPANLSQSGAASQARLLPGPDNTYQAFWLDKFNGLTSATFNGKTWSQPVLSAIPPMSGSKLPSLPANTMPEMILDSTGTLHAFWQSNDGSLLHSTQTALGQTWTPPDLAAGQAAAFSLAVTSGSQGELFLATLRTNASSEIAASSNQPSTAEVPAGIYLRRWQHDEWGASQPVYTSIYYRLITPDQARLDLAVADDGRLAVTWQDPRLSQLLFTESTDNGSQWSQPEALGETGHFPDSVLLAFLPDGSSLRIWRDPAAGGTCPWFQQIKTTEGWQSAQNVFPQLRVCPDSGRLLPVSAGLLWVWGERTTRVNLVEWDASKRAWTLPTQLSFTFTDSQTTQNVTLGDLRLSLEGDKLGVAGSDSVGGEAWATFALTSTVDLAAAPPSLWQAPQLLTQAAPQIDGISLALDSKGLAHTVWSQAITANGPTTSLYYARSNGQNVTHPVQIVQARQDEMARQPALLVDGQDRLHLAYSGGGTGEIFYTRAEAAQADSASSWITPKAVSYFQGSTWPQISLAPDGRLYIVFVIPFNDNRGIYWLRSDDGGETWSAPTLVFDAKVAGWAGVGRLALAIEPNNSLQIVFEKASQPGTWLAQGLYYTAGMPQSDTLSFSQPEQVAGSNSHSPQLALTGTQLTLVYAGVSGLESRQLDVGELSNTWSGAERLAGWQDRSDTGSIFGLAEDTQSAHLAGPLADSSGLRYSTWQKITSSAATSPADSSWTYPDSFYFPQPGLNDNLVAAAARSNGGRLVFTWVTTTEKGCQVNLALRSIPEVMAPIDPTLILTETPTSGVIATAEPPSSTPTRDLNLVAPANKLPADPMVLGGGLAAVLVGIGLAGYLVFKNRR